MDTSRNIENKDEILAQYRSELGNGWTQDHYEEYLEGSLSQMDTRSPIYPQKEKQAIDGIRNEINDDDDRDHHDSTRDWNAENSRTGRHR